MKVLIEGYHLGASMIFHNFFCTSMLESVHFQVYRTSSGKDLYASTNRRSHHQIFEREHDKSHFDLIKYFY